MTVIIFHQNSKLSFHVNQPQLVMFIGTTDDVAFFIKIQTVCSSRFIHKNRKLSVHIIFPDLVIWLISEKNISILVCGRTFRKTKIAVNQYKPCAGYKYSGIYTIICL